MAAPTTRAFVPNAVKEVEVSELPNQGGAAFGHAAPAAVEEAVVTADVIVEDGEVVEEIIDIEEYVRNGRTPHLRAKGYLVRVDKQKILFDKAEVTGREILERAGKQPPEKYILRQVLKGGVLEKVELNQIVDLARHGVEKFKTMLKTAQDGRPSLV